MFHAARLLKTWLKPSLQIGNPARFDRLCLQTRFAFERLVFRQNLILQRYLRVDNVFLLCRSAFIAFGLPAGKKKTQRASQLSSAKRETRFLMLA